MLIETSFPRPIPSFRQPVIPPTSDPFDEPLISVCVNEQWVKYILGSLLQLCLESTWDVSTPDEMKLALQRADTLIGLFLTGCPPQPPQPPSKGIEVLEEMSIHVDCNCNVTVDCCDGTTKQLATVDMLNSVPQTNPPPQPQPGDCTTVKNVLNANQQFLYFSGVGAGDVITMTDISGASNDGGTLNWYCPDGHYYGAGHCGTLGQHTDGGDPCPSLFHMALIAIDSLGNCYDATTDFTIASGVPDGSNLTFQVNDSDLSNNSGSVAFTAKICKATHPTTFYYGLCTDFYLAGGHPEDMTWHVLPLGVPISVTSKVPDGSSEDNLESLIFITFADSFDSGNNAVNSSNTWFTVSAISQSGATLDSGNFWNYDYNATTCQGSVTSTGQTTTPPATTNKYKEIVIRSKTQFVINFTPNICS